MATAAALGIHVAALDLPWTQFVLRVEPIGLDAWGRIVLVGSTILVAMEGAQACPTEAFQASRARILRGGGVGLVMSLCLGRVAGAPWPGTAPPVWPALLAVVFVHPLPRKTVG